MTRKVLVPRDINNPKKYVKDFLFPDPSNGKLVLRGIKTGKEWEHGMVILTSEINEDDIFKSIVDSGKKIESVDALIEALRQYVKILPNYKIGNIVKLNPDSKEVDLVLVHNYLTLT
jgi:hypothetical protein